MALYDDSRFVLYPESCFDYIQNLRRSSYKSCIWYPEIKGKIPTASSILLEVVCKKDLKNSLKENIEQYEFVRLCTMSCKDKKSVPIYNLGEVKDAVTDILTSERTKGLFEEMPCEGFKGKHLFMRERREYEYEARCFWSRDKLRAVSLPENYIFTTKDKNDIENFFKKYGKFIPYHSAMIDIGLTNGNIEIIEFNTTT